MAILVMKGGLVMSEIDVGQHMCPVCGEYEFPCYGSFEICPICMWQDDCIQEDNPDETCCANRKSLNEYKQLWKEWLEKTDDTSRHKMSSCPVCERPHTFEDVGGYIYCSHCDCIDSVLHFLNSDEPEVIDGVSVDKLKKAYRESLRSKTKLCPECGTWNMYHYAYVSTYEMCPDCGWIDDYEQSFYKDQADGANKLSLSQAIAEYKTKNLSRE